ncbi:Crp/Fnr family transcriptional regulator [Guyparkeria sp.]|uniref:Crp/Fnr family transcriptional regulator n=1 Tax=Guyparkeria sp. TaxID=2035736 RepID=UPI003564134E
MPTTSLSLADRQIFPDFFPEDLIAQARLRQLGRGEGLFKMGESVRHVIFVLQGQLKAVRTDPEGTECVMLRAGKGEFFAESSLITMSYACDGVAMKPTRVALLPVDAVQDAMASQGPFAGAMFGLIAAQARKQCSRQERLRLKKARDRIVHYLACETAPGQHVELKVPMKEWACELGLEPETLYRTLADLQSESCLERDGRRLRLVPRATEPTT